MVVSLLGHHLWFLKPYKVVSFSRIPRSLERDTTKKALEKGQPSKEKKRKNNYANNKSASEEEKY